MQGDKNWILPKEMNANRFFLDSHWLEIWSKPLLSLYGTEWRERGYGLRWSRSAQIPWTGSKLSFLLQSLEKELYT